MKKYLFGIICLALVVALCASVPLVASEDFGPFKNREEEQSAAQKAADKGLEILFAEKAQRDAEEKQRIAEEKAMTPEQKKARKDEEKAAKEKKFLEEKAKAKIEFDKLVKELREFKRNHDMNKLTEEEYIEFVTLQGTVLHLSFLVAERQMTPEEVLLSKLDLTYCYEYIAECSRQIEKKSKYPNSVLRYQIDIRHMERQIDLANEVRKKFEEGEDPEMLIEYIDNKRNEIHRMHDAESIGIAFDPDDPDNQGGQ